MKVENMVPEVYYSGSRDFSFIGRVFEIALNYMKTGAEIVGDNIDSDNTNPYILDLLCGTLGFTPKHKYITKDLVYVANIFSQLIKKKGSQDSIEEAITALLSSQGITQDFIISFDSPSKTLNLILPENVKDVVLLEDLFDYILPAGVLVEITYSGAYLEETSEPLYYEDDLMYAKANANQTGHIYTGVNSWLSEEKPSYDGEQIDRAITYIGTVAVDETTENESN